MLASQFPSICDPLESPGMWPLLILTSKVHVNPSMRQTRQRPLPRGLQDRYASSVRDLGKRAELDMACSQIGGNEATILATF